MAGSESGPEQDSLRHSECLLFVEYLNLPGTSSAPCSWWWCHCGWRQTLREGSESDQIRQKRPKVKNYSRWRCETSRMISSEKANVELLSRCFRYVKMQNKPRIGPSCADPAFVFISVKENLLLTRRRDRRTDVTKKGDDSVIMTAKNETYRKYNNSLYC